MLDLGLGGAAALGLERLLARRVGGCASVRDVEAKGLAVNGNQKCSDFGNNECSIFGIKTTVLLASAVQ